MNAFRPSRLLAAILSLAALAGAQDAVAPQGSGRPLDPYLVSSLGNLLWISQNPRSWNGIFEQTADIDARATARLDGGKGFVPIGARTRAFEGVFRGHGHAIRGLTIVRPDSANQGLFGWVGAEGRLDSIVLLEASIVGLASSGTLAGTLEGGTASDCRATGTVRTGYERAGGLVGSNSRGRIRRSRAGVAVSGGASEIGGLVGSSSGEVDDGHASGDVEGFASCGSLVGGNSGLILSSSATGDVVGRGGVGGLVGRNGGSIRYSHAEGSAKIVFLPGEYPGSGAGGLVGHNDAEILHCHASGAVEAGYDGGGLVGWSSGLIEHSYATGNVVVQENRAGGLVGATYGDRLFIPPENSSWWSYGAIRQCYATGTVHAKLWAGGLAGYNSSSVVEQSYAIGAVSGGGEVGGFIGNLDMDSNMAKEKVVGNYWDVERSGQLLGSGNGRVRDFGAAGRTTAAMRARATFVDWDFDTTWSIVEGISTPVLHVRSKPQVIAFPPLGQALLPDSFAVAGAWANSGLPITLTSSDPSVAAIDGGRIRLVSPGTATITARQEGDSTFLPAAPVSQVLRVASFAFAGHGTQADPFRIANLEDLRQLSGDTSIWRAHFVQVADIDASPTAAWDSGRGFQPIGGWRGAWFDGSYNGRGHAITGLTIDRDTSRQLGLFGAIDYAARIDSIRLVDVSIRGRAVCGGLVGRMDGGRITSVDVSGSVECQVTAGGLVGSNHSDDSIVFSSASVAVRGEHLLGGLLGGNFGPVRRSWATGAVVGYWNAGGLVGVNGDTIVDCYARGAVTGDSAIGGLVGQASTFSRIVSSYATGRVEGDIATAGLIGYDNGGSVASSYWDTDATGQILGRGSFTSDDSIFLAVGLTTAEMKARSTYAGWDFSQVWSIDEAADYPVLRVVAAIPSSVRDLAPRATMLARGAYPLEIYDLRGRLAWKGEARWTGVRWELPQLGAGTWVVRARTGQGSVARRVVTLP